MRSITPCLWFDNNAEEAVNFYIGIFQNSKITAISHYGEAGAAASGQPAGSVMVITFELNGQPFMALNGGPLFRFNHAISLVVNCESQAELDELWDRLADGGSIEQCGWLRDRFGVVWQIVPASIGELMDDSNPQQAERVMREVLKMKKIDIAALLRVCSTS